MPFDFGGYRVLRMLGRGGMGAVYEAEQLSTGRRLALKVLGRAIDDDELRRRFLREGRLAAGVTHPNCVYIYGSEEIEGTPVIAMELVDGGTLRDLLKKRGPLRMAEAVDITLQIVAGLEAAAAAGVLHRDIKPANCFISTDGTVKVGDFGLSVSTLARQDSQLTASGAMLGTPSFAAPEQLRGEALDERADIFSVGTTLYCLIAGQPPFEGDNAVQVVAAVLDKTPTPLNSVRSEVPADLAALVARCLAKKRDARFPNYAELRAALLPFSSAAPLPAMPASRVLAHIVDALILFLPHTLAIAITRDVKFEDDHRFIIGTVLLSFFYYSFFESRAGATPGKWLLGLRVSRVSGGNPTFRQALSRVFLFSILSLLTIVVEPRFPVFVGADDQFDLRAFLIVQVPILLSLSLFLTMRRRNGYAALHELLTATRTVQRSVKLTRNATIAAPAFDPAMPGLENVGPYLAGAAIPGSAFRTGFDSLLRRPVWLCAAGTTMESDRTAARAGRLRWIGTTQDNAGGAWEIWESPGGIALTSLPANSQPWETMRGWLSDLAAELDAATRYDMLEPVSLDQIRITDNGRALFLPGKKSGEFAAAPAGAQALLTAVADRWLDRSTLPLHGGECLARFAASTLDRMSFIAGNIAACLPRKAAVSRRRRFFAAAAFPIALLALATVVVLTIRTVQRAPVEFAKAHPTQFHLAALTEYHVGTKADADASRLDHAAGIYLATHSRTFIESPEFEKATAAVLNESQRAAARELIADKREISKDELATATSLLRTAKLLKKPDSDVMPWWSIPVLCGILYTLCAFIQMLLLLATGESPGNRVFGIAAVNSAGRAAGRLWLWLHSLLTVAPLVIAIVIIVPNVKPNPMLAAVVGASVVLLYLAGIALATFTPRRGIADRILGLFIVPR